MCDDKEIDIEEFVKKNREKIEEILKQREGSFRDRFEPKKEKAEDAMRSLLALLFNPDVQKHFIKAGVEVLSGIGEIIKNAPMPEEMKQNVDKAYNAKDKVVKDIVDEMAAPKSKEKRASKKIEVE